MAPPHRGSAGAAGVLLLLAAAAALLSAAPAAAEGFVSIQGTRFLLDGRDFTFTGFNMWQAVEWGANIPPNPPKVYIPTDMTGQQAIDKLLDVAAGAGMRMVRIFAHAVLPGNQLQTSPGVYNERFFKGLDYAVAAAGRRGFKIALSFIDNWSPVGGVRTYVDWCAGRGVAHVNFYTNERCRQIYRNHVDAVTSRVNTITGVTYRNDPAIMAWSLINEPRCKGNDRNGPGDYGGDCWDAIQSWIDAMAPYVKSRAPRQLTTLSEEGFYAGNRARENPGYWAASEGQDFPRNGRSRVDYLSIHFWPDRWEQRSSSFARSWIQSHVNDAAAIGKPLVLEEFGAQDGGREAIFRIVLQAVEASVRSNGPLRGTGVWLLVPDGAPSDDAQFNIHAGDSVFNILRQHSSTLRSITPGGGAPALTRV